MLSGSRVFGSVMKKIQIKMEELNETQIGFGVKQIIERKRKFENVYAPHRFRKRI